MTPEAQRIAIAEACGITNAEQHPTGLWVWVKGSIIEKFKLRWSGTRKGDLCFCQVPDYLSDLNAMHEAEKVLWLTEKWSRYKRLLRQICERDKDQFGYFDRIRATAAQRAEAFLRTLNLYTA